MARHNVASLYGQVCQEPRVKLNPDGSINYSMIYIQTIRSNRKVENDVNYLRYDKILILAKDEVFSKEVASWHVNDMVEVKGTFNTKNTDKPSLCSNPECEMSKKESGGNRKPGSICYVTPIFAEKITHFDKAEDCLSDLYKHREVSNQVYVLGELVREPKKVKVKSKEEGKSGITLTQYQIALDRKFRVKTDPPEIKSDYPWVKSYGKMGQEDKLRLHTGSVVFIDGYIQRRRVTRTSICPCCATQYTWRDDNLELVPYDIEYMPMTFYSDAALENMAKENPDELRQRLYTDPVAEKFDELTDGMSDN